VSTSQRAEATRKPAPPTGPEVTWRKVRFTLPTPAAMPLEALEADAEDFSAQVMKELGRGNP
jgi:hypothetical protein